MLKSLLIKNYALIKHLEIFPTQGLSIVTGETGAGKSIMLGALGLIMGNRADTKALLDENEKCIIEAEFDISSYKLQPFFDKETLDYDSTCLIRREIAPNNKSRAFINDTPVTLEALKNLGSKLMDIHSQHETLMLGSSNFQLFIIDTYADNSQLLAQYKETFYEWLRKKEKIETIEDFINQKSKEQDFNSFLLNELSEASLEEGEQEKLEEEIKLLENAEEIKTKLQEILYLLSNGEINGLQTISQSLKNFEILSSISSSYEDLRKRMEGCLHEMKDLISEAESREERIESDQERGSIVRERIDKINTLQKKHSARSVEELLQIQAELEKSMGGVLDSEEELARLKKEIIKDKEVLEKASEKLSKSRKSVFEKICAELKSLLAEVGINDASILIEHTPLTEPTATGKDQIRIMFSANKGIKLQEIKNAASGGEFSRLMLCLKYILAGKTALPTIVFDEIDTGISGEIAFKVGKIMQQMAKNHQVICISHLPQIAAMGEKHYYVYKDNSHEKAISNIRELSKEERIMEIAQMIGGANPSETSLQNARELLGQAS